MQLSGVASLLCTIALLSQYRTSGKSWDGPRLPLAWWRQEHPSWCPSLSSNSLPSCCTVCAALAALLYGTAPGPCANFAATTHQALNSCTAAATEQLHSVTAGQHAWLAHTAAC